MTDRLRIGLMTPGWPGTATPNGIATSVRHMAAGLREIGQEPVILGNQDGPLPDDVPFVALPESDWNIVNRLRAKVLGGSRVNADLRVKSIVRAIREARAQHGLDVVIMEESMGWAGRVLRAVEVPVIVNLHGPWSLLSQVFGRPLDARDRARIADETRAFEAAAGIMAPSEISMSVTRDLDPAIPRAVIPNACPPVPGAGDGAHLPGHILYVGRVERLKGTDTVLAAFETLAARRPEARLTYVGPDRGLLMEDGRTVDMAEAMDTLVPSSRDRIDFRGSLTPDEIAKLRRTHPIALMASRFENLNYTMLEAIAAGQAVVSTEVGGPAEVLTDGVTARLVPPGDADAMAAALERLLADPALRGSLVAGASAMLAARFHPRVVAERTVSFCREVLARRSH